MNGDTKPRCISGSDLHAPQSVGEQAGQMSVRGQEGVSPGEGWKICGPAEDIPTKQAVSENHRRASSWLLIGL